jgi:hypothetical protein
VTRFQRFLAENRLRLGRTTTEMVERMHRAKHFVFMSSDTVILPSLECADERHVEMLTWLNAKRMRLRFVTAMCSPDTQLRSDGGKIYPGTVYGFLKPGPAIEFKMRFNNG